MFTKTFQATVRMEASHVGLIDAALDQFKTRVAEQVRKSVEDEFVEFVMGDPERSEDVGDFNLQITVEVNDGD